MIHMEIDYIATNTKETKFQIKEGYFASKLDSLKNEMQDLTLSNVAARNSELSMVLQQMDGEIQKHGDGVKGFIVYHCKDLLANELRVMTFLHRYQGIPLTSDYDNYDPDGVVAFINSGILHEKNVMRIHEEEKKRGGEGGGGGGSG